MQKVALFASLLFLKLGIYRNSYIYNSTALSQTTSDSTRSIDSVQCR